MNNTCLYHHGVKGMKWGVRKRDKESFNTSHRDTAVSKNGKLLTVDGQNVDYKSKASRKAARAALREGNAYNKTFKSKARINDQLSVMGNKYTEKMKEYSNKKSTSSNNKYWKNVAIGGAVGTGAAIATGIILSSSSKTKTLNSITNSLHKQSRSVINEYKNLKRLF